MKSLSPPRRRDRLGRKTKIQSLFLERFGGERLEQRRVMDASAMPSWEQSPAIPTQTLSIDSGVTATAAAQSGDFTYTSGNGAVTITGYTGTNTSVVIPSSIATLPVTHIASNAFQGNAVMTNVTVPRSVTSIGASAFGSCPQLKAAYFDGPPPVIAADSFLNSPATIYLASTEATESVSFDTTLYSRNTTSVVTDTPDCVGAGVVFKKCCFGQPSSVVHPPQTAARPESKLGFKSLGFELPPDPDLSRTIFVNFGNPLTINGDIDGGNLAMITYDARQYGSQPFRFTINGTASEWTASGNKTTGSWVGEFKNANDFPYNSNIPQSASNTKYVIWCPLTNTYSGIVLSDVREYNVPIWPAVYGGLPVAAYQQLSVPSGQTATPALAAETSRVLKQGAGTAILSTPSTRTGGTVVEAGELVVRNMDALGTGLLEVQAGAKATFQTGYDTVSVTSLSLASTSRLEIGTSKLTVAANGFTESDIRSKLIAGRNGGSWDGPSGITSTFAGGDRAIGYRVTGGALEVAYAAPGDSNLDGVIDILDIAGIVSAGKFNTGTSANWQQGDVNYDGILDDLDIADIVGAGLYDGGSYRTQPAASSAAVETGTVATFDPAMVFAAFAMNSSSQTATKRKSF